MEYNGGSVVAMVGKDCVAIASDLRLGNQALTIATNFEKVRELSILQLPRDVSNGGDASVLLSMVESDRLSRSPL
jgi:Proteasome subunit